VATLPPYPPAATLAACAGSNVPGDAYAALVAAALPAGAVLWAVGAVR
jgi:hypothetical protein